MRAPRCCLSFPSMAIALIRGRRHRWRPGTMSSLMLKQKWNNLARSQVLDLGRVEMLAKCLFALGSTLPSHNNIRGLSVGRVKTNIEQSGQTNKSTVYLATCEPAGEEMAIRWHRVLRDSVWWTKWMKTTETLDLLPPRILYRPFIRITNELYFHGQCRHLWLDEHRVWCWWGCICQNKPDSYICHTQTEWHLWHLCLELINVGQHLAETVTKFRFKLLFFCSTLQTHPEKVST